MSAPADTPETILPTSEPNVDLESGDATADTPLDVEPRRTVVVLPPQDNDYGIEERPTGGLNRPRGTEMRRELTKEEKELAQAGYDHIIAEKNEEHITEKGDSKDPKDVNIGKMDITEHGYSLEDLENVLVTSFVTKEPAASPGLHPKEAAERLLRDGKNILTPPKKKSAFMKYLDCLKNMFNILLILAGILEYVLLGINFEANFANTYLGGILIAVAFLNAFIEFYQLQKADAILQSFLALIPPSCRVIRGGTLLTTPAAELVKGDVVFVRMGDKTPADLVLFNSTDLKVDNSSLTGESEPQERHPLPDGSPYRAVEAENLVAVKDMEVCTALVDSWLALMKRQIAKLTGGESGNKSPLATEIGNFVAIMSTIAIVFALVFFGVGIGTVYRGNVGATVTFAVSILVAFVPEGLPSVVTLLLSIAAKRMAAQNVLVKDLQGVETLGALTLLATDKTGTLTRNQMTVTNIWNGTNMSSAFQSNNDADDTVPFSFSTPGMSEIIDVCALNSKIKFDKSDIPFEQREILGDATETGLARFAGRHLPDYDRHHKDHPKVFEVPFNSTNKWALSTVKKVHADGFLTVMLKGAPERVLAKCTTYLNEGVSTPVDDAFNKSFDDAYSYMASRGHRVIACAQYNLPGHIYPENFAFTRNPINYPETGYTFVGLVSLEDPPKHGVREAIGTLRLAGIKVMMVTGDHPKTAEAIARKINLILGETKQTLSARTGRPLSDIYDDEVSAVVVHGDDIDGLQGFEWDASVFLSIIVRGLLAENWFHSVFAKEEIVFARTSPKHKLEIVKRAQALGHIVGVTGDGVNDSPALKKADLGIAMNISGSDVSKEAANMILLDDNFASTVKGVAEGRLIFNNLKRSIQYTITHITPEVIPQLLYVVVPIPLPLSAILILVIDLGFEIFVGLSFAWDPPESKDGLMRLKPRKPVTDRSILSIKKRALRRTKTLRRDSETQTLVTPGRFRQLLTKLRAPFTRIWWEDRLERTEDETLVDGKLLSYAYLEAGIIEFAACIVSYFVIFLKHGFSPADLRRAQKATIYFAKSSPDFITNAGRVIDSKAQLEALAQAQSICAIPLPIR
ncbi:hypothetical protein Clacol_006134 [Clathrus columnatus]|uniref:Cation-transporting P-type ATPase N-terminal domain-containing protein n=1 Tax=Clathrus columnatus TaxID=1419009 RepID=A0AAV5AB79_9AGAM|nr:hypothetical protein Clacol_006134 [Clathrus columnatus]